MHTNRWLYKQFHSVHHRLYVPYAFGALYNHPLEGLVLDTVGTGIAEFLACMTTREAMLLFLVSSLKTVDDHCGYSLPFDPLQLLTSNNADYHDIHHQVRRRGAPDDSRGVCSHIGVAGHWHQVELRTAILRALGHHSRHADDSPGYRGASQVSKEAIDAHELRARRAHSLDPVVIVSMYSYRILVYCPLYPSYLQRRPYTTVRWFLGIVIHLSNSQNTVDDIQVDDSSCPSTYFSRI